jgi:DNA-binding NarL/FixJ family response regulator
MTGGDTATSRIRVAIIDDHTLFREGVGLMLALEPDVALVGEASTVEQGLAVIARTSPDLVLLDLRLAQARGATCSRAWPRRLSRRGSSW